MKKKRKKGHNIILIFKKPFSHLTPLIYMSLSVHQSTGVAAVLRLWRPLRSPPRSSPFPLHRIPAFAPSSSIDCHHHHSSHSPTPSNPSAGRPPPPLQLRLWESRRSIFQVLSSRGDLGRRTTLPLRPGRAWRRWSKGRSLSAHQGSASTRLWRFSALTCPRTSGWHSPRSTRR